MEIEKFKLKKRKKERNADMGQEKSERQIEAVAGLKVAKMADKNRSLRETEHGGEVRSSRAMSIRSWSNINSE